jgi:hypothetical protein
MQCFVVNNKAVLEVNKTGEKKKVISAKSVSFQSRKAYQEFLQRLNKWKNIQKNTKEFYFFRKKLHYP